MQMAGQTSVVVSSGAKGESRAAPLERAVWQSCHCDRSACWLLSTHMRQSLIASASREAGVSKALTRSVQRC